jgi:hypothetical protein
MATRFEPAPRPRWENEIRSQPSYDAGMKLRTRTVATAVRIAAPEATGYYRRRIRVIGHSVVATDPFGHLVEYGSVNNPAYAPLRRGTLAAGLRLDITLL